MLKNILAGGMGLFFSLYLHAQIANPNQIIVEKDISAETMLFEQFTMPTKGNISGTRPSGIRFSGGVKDSRLHGEWKSWFPNNQLHEQGNLENGLPNGEWKVWFPSGQIRYVRTYSSDKYKRIRQEWLRPHPKMPNYKLTTLYLNNRKDAIQLITSSYSFKENDSQDFHIPVFKNCLHHGLFINYNENGSLRDSGFYKNGLREGVWIESATIENGYTTGFYKNGQKSGSWKYFNSNKLLMRVSFFELGKKKWEKEIKSARN